MTGMTGGGQYPRLHISLQTEPAGQTAPAYFLQTQAWADEDPAAISQSEG